MRHTVLSSSLASSSSGSVVTEGVLGLYQEICSTRPLNLAPWLAAYKTKTGQFKGILTAFADFVPAQPQKTVSLI